MIGNLEAEILKNNKKLKNLVETSNKEKFLIAEREGHISSMKDEVELLRSKNNAQERELTVIREELFEVNREYERKNKIFEEIKEQKNIGEDEVNRLRKTMSEKSGLITSMEKEIKCDQIVINDNNLQLKVLVNDLDEKTLRERCLRTKRDEVRGEKEHLNENLKISQNRISKLEKEINEYNKEIEANEEFIHLKEEEELFLTKKIEALESLILEKKKREALSGEKKREQEHITRIMAKRLDDVNQKYQMIKQREDNELKHIRHGMLEIDRQKHEITKIKNEIDSTIQTLSDLKKRRDSISKESLRLNSSINKNKSVLHDVLSGNPHISTDEISCEDELFDHVPDFRPGRDIEV